MFIRSSAVITLVPALSLGFLTDTGFAQDGSSVIVQRDEGGTHVMQFTMPDLAALRTPDFTRRDLPLFTGKLLLSDAQTDAIGRLIDAYLESFIALTKDLALVVGADAEYIADADAENAAPPDAGRRLAGAMSGVGNRVDFSDLEAELPPGSEVGVSVGITTPQRAPAGQNQDRDDAEGDAPNESPPEPQAEVSVNIDSPESDIDPALLEKFQQRADEMAAQIVKDIQAREEAAANGEVEPPAPGREGPRIALPGGDGEGVDMETHALAVREKVEEFTQAKAKLRADFGRDAQINLSEEQVGRWPALERALTRERRLPRGRLAGETTDLMKVLAAQKIAESELESIAPQVETYELVLDAALKQRDGFIADVNQQIDAAIAERKPDRALQLADRAAALRVSVRTVNQQHAEHIAQALEDARGEAFRTAAMKSFYPNVYQSTRGRRLFTELAEVDGLAADLAASLNELRAQYEAELASLNEQIRQTIDREQPKEPRRRLEQLKRTLEGADDEEGRDFLQDEGDPIRAAMEKRAELDDRYIKSVLGMVPAEVATNLPKPRTHKGPVVVRSGG